ncbi:MAG: hypothetical protein US68_C0006G0043 [Candidatus Shapirobacteria bacterium GW2011_GWE1_38_10]|uniref:Mannosyl-glycoprotein endo-beta-N-acetylglucosamidase-like domain-containing protein n=1 Tax=Candidatus Shapirobacteria bacterium GW2011_GWE1_38_10 TaxID=1618488 RepID=A0A0G0I4V5_9BACT|nr:MAG: hypothetical protein US46_C0002G0136 [Candidatus Shapirobacteria bacterium GW2011_GWF2_37_20]KKQ50363.1 MAG: hypothetical protein US68_C0006G0043 [Candidatus Shapirobacteria bacterium GW2011_GWE1_38_10]KKQ65187.1 MAG: hypothetical protein US85_C0001G0114 [Candidatus Shapirobacteria bacterium GW2011_GWF1_38_23]HBP50788.1 hypothetical protein [Candidatus Shapirobacteria bacterium]
MEKAINKIGKMCFYGVLGVLLVGLVVGECIYLLDYKGNKNIVRKNLANGKLLTLAAEENGSDSDVEISGQVTESDARPIIIERYLAKYKSPLLPYAKEIFELSEAYGFEYYWIVAIAQQESNLCKKIPEDSHNCWGYGINSSGTLRFENYDLALKAYASYLKIQYFDKGLNTPELIMKKYCPHSNGSWARGVQQFIDEMENGV